MAEKKLSISIMILCFVFNIAVLNSNGTDGIKLEYCCKFTASSDQLMACVNDSNAKNYESWAHSAVLHPILRLVMVTRASPNVYEYAAYSYFVQSLYSAREGYTMLPLFADSPQQDYTYHRKLVPMLEALRDERNNADYIAWIDAGIVILTNVVVYQFLPTTSSVADLIPLDLNLKIEKVAATYRSAHIIMSSDVSSIGNTGFIIVRGGSQWAEAFFEEWLQQMNSPGVDTEQLGFDTVYRKRDQAEMNAKVAILAPHVLNSIAAPMGQQLPHHKVFNILIQSYS